MAVTIRSVLGRADSGVIPDGRTVTPINDISIWLRCGGIFDKSYTTIREVLDDYKSLIILIGDSNAVDYMARSTTWENAVCSNEIAMIAIGLNEYCANTLLNKRMWNLAIVESEYMTRVLNIFVPIMTSATEPSGLVFASSEWSAGYASWRAFNAVNGEYWSSASGQVTNQYIGYEFESSIKVYSVSITNYDSTGRSVKLFNVQYLDNGEWVNCSETEYENPATASLKSKYTVSPQKSSNSWRIFISNNHGDRGEIDIRKMQFYGRI